MDRGRSNFLVHVNVLARLFRRQAARDARGCARRRPAEVLQHTCRAHRQRARSSAFLAPLRKIEWVVYARSRSAGPEQVLRYLSRYTHRVAISNRRLVSADDIGVTFKLQGLSRRRPRPLQDHDARRARVHPALPHARPAKGLPPHSPLRAVSPTAIAPTTSHAPASCSPCRARASSSPRKRRPQRPIEPRVLPYALSVLRRSHARHRGLRAWLRAHHGQRLASDVDQDRHVMTDASLLGNAARLQEAAHRPASIPLARLRDRRPMRNCRASR